VTATPDEGRLELDDHGAVVEACTPRASLVDLDLDPDAGHAATDRGPDVASSWLVAHRPLVAAGTGLVVVAALAALGPGGSRAAVPTPDPLPAAATGFRDPATGAVVMTYVPPQRPSAARHRGSWAPGSRLR
jgi:hypothetical protein